MGSSITCPTVNLLVAVTGNRDARSCLFTTMRKPCSLRTPSASHARTRRRKARMVTILPRYARAGAQAQSLQSAADSAALAGAQAIARDRRLILDTLVFGRVMPMCGKGQAEAMNFARRNSAVVTHYCYLPLTARVQVTVRSATPLENGQFEERRATAKVGPRLAPCIGDLNIPLPVVCGEFRILGGPGATGSLHTEAMEPWRASLAPTW